MTTLLNGALHYLLDSNFNGVSAQWAINFKTRINNHILRNLGVVIAYSERNKNILF